MNCYFWGNLLSSHLFDAFGTFSSTASTTSDPFSGYGGQAGYVTDWETGLQLCGHRYYDAASGRWINRDPIGYAGGINLYGYVGNDPLTWMDPLGLDGSFWGQLGQGSTWGAGLRTSWNAALSLLGLGDPCRANDPGFNESRICWGIAAAAGGAAGGAAGEAAAEGATAAGEAGEAANAAEAAEAEGGGFDVALGHKHTGLQPFANDTGSLHWNQWPGYNGNLGEQFGGYMDQAPNINFNLADVDTTRTDLAGLPQPPTYLTTEWEYQQIINNEEWFNKTQWWDHDYRTGPLMEPF